LRGNAISRLPNRADGSSLRAAMTRPQVEICAKLLMLAIVVTFCWGFYHVLALMGVF
jgi:hypothetical protein